VREGADQQLKMKLKTTFNRHEYYDDAAIGYEHESFILFFAFISIPISFYSITKRRFQTALRPSKRRIKK
jgi:hypothetical protein